MIGLFAKLRRRRYDLAFDGGLTSLSSALYMLLAGVPERVGKQGESAPLLTVKPPIDEAALANDVRAIARNSLRVAPPLRIRDFAAVLARARILVAPDSGPMHLAAALGVPVVALVETERSRYLVPSGDENDVLFRADAVLASLHARRDWTQPQPRARHAAPIERRRAHASLFDA